MSGIAEFLLGGTGLELWGFAAMCAVSFLASFITAMLGLGGGILMLATMALFLTPAVLIPVHGVVQLGSNLGRAALMARHVMFRYVPVFFLGTLLGAAIGGRLVVTLPTALLQGVLAAFILYAVWMPKIRARAPGRWVFFGVGALSTFATMFVGATGPLVAPFVAAASTERQQVVATHGALMVMQHGLKLVVFGLLGFSIAAYVPLLAGLLAFGFAGTYAGRHVLTKLPEAWFRAGLKAVLTMIAARLLFGALTG